MKYDDSKLIVIIFKPLIPLIGDHTPQITEINGIDITKLTVKSF